MTNLTNSRFGLKMKWKEFRHGREPNLQAGEEVCKAAPGESLRSQDALSSLVERAAKGEEIVIAKAGKPMAKLTPVSERENGTELEPLPFGKNLLGITYIADDFYDDLPPELFEDGESDFLFRTGGMK